MQGASQIKPRLGQGRAGIKWKIKLPVSTLLDRPIIQLKEKLISQQSRYLEQLQITWKVPVPEQSWIDDKIIPVPDYPIPETIFGDETSSRTVKRKTIQDISREIPTYPDTIYRPLPKPTEIPLQEIPRSLTDLDTGINMDFEEKFPLSRWCDIRNITKTQ